MKLKSVEIKWRPFRTSLSCEGVVKGMIADGNCSNNLINYYLCRGYTRLDCGSKKLRITKNDNTNPCMYSFWPKIFSPLFPLGFAATFWLTSSKSSINTTQHTTHANTTMAKVLTSIVLLSSSAQAFVARPITSRNDINSHSSLKMSEIEVVSQPDKDFLEKKG